MIALLVDIARKKNQILWILWATIIMLQKSFIEVADGTCQTED